MGAPPLSTRAVVVGGGIAGLAAAVTLARAGLAVDLLEGRSGDAAEGTDPRTTAVLMPGVRFLAELGVWARVQPEATPLARLRVVSEAGDGTVDADVTFEARELDLPAFGYNVTNRSLHAGLRAAFLHLPAATLHEGTLAIDASFDGARAQVATADGRTFASALVVAADGRRSPLREAAGISASSRSTGQTAIVTTFRHELPHHQTSIEVHRRGGPFTMVPLPGHRSSLVWLERQAEAERLLALDEAGFATALDARARRYLGATAPLAPPRSFPVTSLQARTVTGARVVLVGEAAHVLSPLGAQGFNLSLRDAEALGRLVADAVAADTDPGAPELLDRYAGERSTDIRARVAAVEAFGRLVDSDALPVRLLRGTGMRAMASLGPLRREVMRRLMAPVRLPF